MKKIFAFALALCMVLSLCACGAAKAEEPKTEAPAAEAPVAAAPAAEAPAAINGDIVVLYTNDVHCGVENGLTYQGVAAVKAGLEAAGKTVLLVDCGDHSQGGTIGTLSKGEYLVDLMNYVGYDVGTFGNHEFDYGMDQLAKLVEKADMDYVSANFRYIGEGDGAVDPEPYTIKTYGDVKIAYVGIATPESLTKSAPVNFQDENGEWIYTFGSDARAQNSMPLFRRLLTQQPRKNPITSLHWHIWVMTKFPSPGVLPMSLPTPPALMSSSTVTLIPSFPAVW